MTMAHTAYIVINIKEIVRLSYLQKTKLEISSIQISQEFLSVSTANRKEHVLIEIYKLLRGINKSRNMCCTV